MPESHLTDFRFSQSHIILRNNHHIRFEIRFQYPEWYRTPSNQNQPYILCQNQFTDFLSYPVSIGRLNIINDKNFTVFSPGNPFIQNLGIVLTRKIHIITKFQKLLYKFCFSITCRTIDINRLPFLFRLLHFFLCGLRHYINSIRFF